MKGNPWIQKLIGLGAAYLVGLAANYGLELSPEALAGVMITVLSAVEFFVSKRTNPGNASSAHLAEKESVEVEKLKVAEEKK